QARESRLPPASAPGGRPVKQSLPAGSRMEVSILGGGQGWHVAELDRAFRARGHQAHVVRVSALVAHIGDRPRLDDAGVALQDVDAVLARSIPAGSLEQVIFRVDALHWLERLGIPVMNPATAIERPVDKFYTS